jgi:hypothetical protein
MWLDLGITKPFDDALRHRVEMLQMQLSQLQKMIFGSKHERVALISPNQLLLDLGLSPLPEVKTKTEDIAYTRNKTKVKAQPNRTTGNDSGFIFCKTIQEGYICPTCSPAIISSNESM